MLVSIQKQSLKFFGMVLVCLMFLIDSKSASALTLDTKPLTQITTIGDMTNVDIWMNNPTGGKVVAGLYLTLNFDPDFLLYKDFKFGKRPMLFDDCADLGILKIAAIDLRGFDQNEPLLSVQFMSLNAGISSLTSNIEIYNIWGKSLGTALDTENIEVIETSIPVPEPPTMFLLCGGLAGLAFWRKRKPVKYT